MSFKVEVLGRGETKWVSNALRFRTQKEAKAYQENLYSRWMGMEAGRVKRSTDPVNYRADEYGNAKPLGDSRTRRFKDGSPMPSAEQERLTVAYNQAMRSGTAAEKMAAGDALARFLHRKEQRQVLGGEYRHRPSRNRINRRRLGPQVKI